MIKLAHRGYYVSDDCRENSSAAILKAIKLGYDMVEVDIRETKDQQIILSHDQNLNRVFGLNKKVNNLTLKDIQIKTGGEILTLENCLELCKDKIGLLIEVKDKDYSADFLENIHQLVQKYDMVNQVWLYPPRGDLINSYLGKIKVGVSYKQVKELYREGALADKVFVLGMPNVWDAKRLKEMHENNLLCLTTVKKTYFARNFPDKNHLKLAETTIERLKDSGIDAINVDSYYHQFLFDS